MLGDVSELCCGDVTGEATILFPRDFERFPAVVIGSVGADVGFVVGAGCTGLKR